TPFEILSRSFNGPTKDSGELIPEDLPGLVARVLFVLGNLHEKGNEQRPAPDGFGRVLDLRFVVSVEPKRSDRLELELSTVQETRRDRFASGPLLHYRDVELSAFRSLRSGYE